ncbi:MAG: HNH endonuclease [Betaproteobacteria bacterium]|nr:HNH endonuclease [Betaproteobacteria bacterium]
MKPRALATVILAAIVIFSPVIEAKIPRSAAAKAEFKRENPCPATGKQHGACPGWQIDHITPLKCGGPDTPANMQWLTIKNHKVKTKREAKRCR